MSEEGAHTGSAVPIAASLAEFTDKLIARRGVEQSNLLFGGQIGPATRALSARTNSIGVTTSASWNVTYRPWRTTLAPILITLDRLCRSSP